MTSTPLSDKARAITLTRLGLKNVKGLRQWRERLNIAPEPKPGKERKPRAPSTHPRYGQQVQCIETGRVYPSHEAVVREFGGSIYKLKAHMAGNPKYTLYFGHTFRPWAG